MKQRAQILIALCSGLLFGAGLVLSGMTQPSKVLGFLDVGGAWDASLMFVMVGGIAAYATAFHLAPDRPRFAPAFDLPTRRDIDARLVLGAALFGAGWGTGGMCPGPSLVMLPSAQPGVLMFVLAMLCGMLVVKSLEQRRTRPPKAYRNTKPNSLSRSYDQATELREPRSRRISSRVAASSSTLTGLVK